MKSICYFNNKGGVGKTTLVCNVASYIATHHGLRVLLVDADPQCNATQLILVEDRLEIIYGSRHTTHSSHAKKTAATTTLYDVLQPIARGDSTVIENIKPILGSRNRFGVDLIPGHPRVALLEDQFSQAWVAFGGGDLGGARRTNWNTQLLTAITDQYDIIFFDVGPSLGSLNRSVLVGVDYFVTPMGCDIFSMVGVDNISRWIKEWLKWYSRALATCREKWGEQVDEYPMSDDPDRIARFAGYTVQQYITKSIGGEPRATKAYEKILTRIPKAISKELGGFVPSNIKAENLRLGDVPNMFSLVPLAQAAHAPIHGLESGDGLVGSQYAQKKKYVGFIEDLTGTLLKNIAI